MSSPYGAHPNPPSYGPNPGSYAGPEGGHPGYGPPPPPPGPAYGAPAAGAYAPPPGAGPKWPVFPPPAHYGMRVCAYLVDRVLVTLLFLAVIYGPMVLLTALLEPEVGSPEETILIVTILASLVIAAFAYFAYYWIPHARSGQTPGKRLFGIKVIRITSGEPPSLGLSAGRQLVAFVMAWATCVGTLVDLLWPLWDEPYRQALHDKAVGTRVITVRGAQADPYGPQAGAEAGGWY